MAVTGSLSSLPSVLAAIVLDDVAASQSMESLPGMTANVGSQSNAVHAELAKAGAQSAGSILEPVDVEVAAMAWKDLATYAVASGL